MNIFFLKSNDNEFLIGDTGLSFNNVIYNEKKDGVIFLNGEEIVGFNINNFKNNLDLKPGRIILNENLSSYIDEYLKIKVNKNQQSFFKIGKVLESKKIEGTHLSNTIVDIGSEKLNIVCGAANVRSGLNVVVATIGIIMNDGTTIMKGNLRGHESYGMLCSKKELGIDNKKFNDIGIIELDDSYQIGDIFYEAYSNKG